MPAPTPEETNSANQLAISYANVIDFEVFKLQGRIDDRETDAILQDKKNFDIKRYLEIRQKGYPSHRGKTCKFPNGWKSPCFYKDNGIDPGVYYDGILINQSVIEGYLAENRDFYYLVEIIGYKPRVAHITIARIHELLAQPERWEISTNSRIAQLVKTVPIPVWFEEYN